MRAGNGGLEDRRFRADRRSFWADEPPPSAQDAEERPGSRTKKYYLWFMGNKRNGKKGALYMEQRSFSG